LKCAFLGNERISNAESWPIQNPFGYNSNLFEGKNEFYHEKFEKIY